MTTQWQQIRKRRDSRIKRNRVVMYCGTPMRIAGLSSGDGLLLRWQHYAHPNDVEFELTEAQKTALEMIGDACKAVFLADGVDSEVERAGALIIRDLLFNYAAIDCPDTDTTEPITMDDVPF